MRNLVIMGWGGKKITGHIRGGKHADLSRKAPGCLKEKTMKPKKQRMTKPERKLTKIILELFRHDLDLIGKGILNVLILAWRNKSVDGHKVPKKPDLPKAPFLLARTRQRGDLLMFVPRSLESLLIDHLTGTYGYSHLAVDCGENDATGKPVMIESTTGEVVQKKYQDEYGPRHYVRIPLADAGVDTETFCKRAESKLGEPYDDLEALTWGDIDDPAKQVCSDLATVGLSDKMREDIAKKAREGKLRPGSVSVHSRSTDPNVKEFISPNGFAQYFGAPPGRDVTEPGQIIIPHILGTPHKARAGWHSWLITLLIAAGGALWLLVLHKPRLRSSRYVTI